MADFRFAWGSLAVVVAAACASTPEPADLPAPASSASSPVAMSTVRKFGPPDRVDFPDDGTVTVRFVTYGDMDPDDEIPFGMMPNIQIAIIKEREPLSEERALSIRHLEDWWIAVGGNDLGIERRIPPGVRVQSTAEKLATAPARFITTGSDGTVEISIDYTDDGAYEYSFCIISPIVDDLIAGCNYQSINLWRYIRTSGTMTIYVYFTHGYAIVEEGPDGSDRYQRFSEGVKTSDDPVTVWILAGIHDDIWSEDGESSQPFENAHVTIVKDAHVNAWWEAISNDGANDLDMERLNMVRGMREVLAHDWVHMMTTGQDGLGEIELLPGNYLFCESISGCLYENIANTRIHVLGINFFDGGNAGTIGKMSEDEVRGFIKKYLNNRSSG